MTISNQRVRDFIRGEVDAASTWHASFQRFPEGKRTAQVMRIIKQKVSTALDLEPTFNTTDDVDHFFDRVITSPDETGLLAATLEALKNKFHQSLSAMASGQAEDDVDNSENLPDDGSYGAKVLTAVLLEKAKLIRDSKGKTSQNARSAIFGGQRYISRNKQGLKDAKSPEDVKRFFDVMNAYDQKNEHWPEVVKSYRDAASKVHDSKATKRRERNTEAKVEIEKKPQTLMEYLSEKRLKLDAYRSDFFHRLVHLSQNFIETLFFPEMKQLQDSEEETNVLLLQEICKVLDGFHSFLLQVLSETLSEEKNMLEIRKVLLDRILEYPILKKPVPPAVKRAMMDMVVMQVAMALEEVKEFDDSKKIHVHSAVPKSFLPLDLCAYVLPKKKKSLESGYQFPVAKNEYPYLVHHLPSDVKDDTVISAELVSKVNNLFHGGLSLRDAAFIQKFWSQYRSEMEELKEIDKSASVVPPLPEVTPSVLSQASTTATSEDPSQVSPAETPLSAAVPVASPISEVASVVVELPPTEPLASVQPRIAESDILFHEPTIPTPPPIPPEEPASPPLPLPATEAVPEPVSFPTPTPVKEPVPEPVLAPVASPSAPEAKAPTPPSFDFEVLGGMIRRVVEECVGMQMKPLREALDQSTADIALRSQRNLEEIAALRAAQARLTVELEQAHALNHRLETELSALKTVPSPEQKPEKPLTVDDVQAVLSGTLHSVRRHLEELSVLEAFMVMKKTLVSRVSQNAEKLKPSSSLLQSLSQVRKNIETPEGEKAVSLQALKDELYSHSSAVSPSRHPFLRAISQCGKSDDVDAMDKEQQDKFSQVINAVLSHLQEVKPFKLVLDSYISAIDEMIKKWETFLRDRNAALGFLDPKVLSRTFLSADPVSVLGKEHQGLLRDDPHVAQQVENETRVLNDLKKTLLTLREHYDEHFPAFLRHEEKAREVQKILDHFISLRNGSTTPEHDPEYLTLKIRDKTFQFRPLLKKVLQTLIAWSPDRNAAQGRTVKNIAKTVSDLFGEKVDEIDVELALRGHFLEAVPTAKAGRPKKDVREGAETLFIRYSRLKSPNPSIANNVMMTFILPSYLGFEALAILGELSAEQKETLDALKKAQRENFRRVMDDRKSESEDDEE